MGLEPGRIPHIHEASRFLGNSSAALIDQAGGHWGALRFHFGLFLNFDTLPLSILNVTLKPRLPRSCLTREGCTVADFRLNRP